MANFIVFVNLSALFLIIVLLLDHVSARNCAEMETIMNCNECIRCGGHWCNKPDKQGKHCTDQKTTDWCPNDRETLTSVEEVTSKGITVSPIYAETTAFVHVPNKMVLSYTATKKPEVQITVVNTTQNFNIEFKSVTECSTNKSCTTNLHATPKTDFCSQTGRSSEIVNVKVKLGEIDEDVMVKYHVPCACECSKKVEKNADQCNRKGDFSCGVCNCQDGWVGEFCEEKVCTSNRGDLECTNNARNDVECSGNGYCDACQTCECFTDREGSQYFDKDNYCADLCMITNDCDDCLSNPTQGFCDDCIPSSTIIIDRYNKSIVSEIDELGRKVWVKCNETLTNGCYVEYVAMKDESGDVHVMVMRLCDTVLAAYIPEPVNVTIPIVLGLVGLLAAAAAVGGFLLHKNRTPPLPMTDPHYQNIGAEDCVGENPLYKPPTSSFKNPTYGKW